MISKIKKNFKYLKLKDFFAVFIFFIIFPLALVYRLWLKMKNKKLWLICESIDTAGDNGYHFFKYLRLNHPEIDAYYAIDKKSADYKKVCHFGNVINFGSFKHWLYYLAAEKNISSQKGGNPSPAIFYVLHIYGLIRNNRVFLQHGVIKDDLKWLYYKETKFEKFICGAKPEYDYLKKIYGYPEGNLVYTGLARFDALHDFDVNRKQIVIMPTWRNWLGRYTNISNHKNVQPFEETLYFKKWSGLLKDKNFISFIEKHDISVYFYPHFNMQQFVELFTSESPNIKIVNRKTYDIQKLLKESALLITDYSSVFMDFAYMHKPMIFYQFDQKEYREKQYAEGYFSYERDGFGPVVKIQNEVLKAVKDMFENNFDIEKKYDDRIKDFFPLNDTNNCKRIYNSIIQNHSFQTENVYTKKDVQILLSIMNEEEPDKYIETMNVKDNYVIINQIPDKKSNINLTNKKKNNKVVVSVHEKGLSKSRNLAIENSTCKIGILSDNDMYYEDNYDEIISSYHNKYPDADVIAFIIEYENKEMARKVMKEGKIGFIRAMKSHSPQITFKLDRIKKAKITFNENFGSGSKFFMGEENIFLADCLRKGLKIYYVPVKIGKLRSLNNSLWFKGYNKEYFMVKGAVFYCMSKLFCPVLILQFAVRKYSRYSENMGIFNAISYMFKGIKEYKEYK